MSDPKGDDPFKGDKRTDETVMISSGDLSDIVDQAKGGADQPSAVEQAAAAQAATGGPNIAVIVLAVIAVLAVVAIAVVALG